MRNHSTHGGMTKQARLALPMPAEMAAIDRVAAETVPLLTLMENAGQAVARAVRRLTGPCRVLVLCGPGNNGGDGYVAARLLAAAGWPVAVAVLAEPRPGTEAAAVAARFRGPRVAFAPEEAARVDLVIDAVFGAGLSRDLSDLVAATLAAARKLVAIDTPSGVDGATGALRGHVPQAALTVSFFRAKPGHLLYPGRGRCGRLEIRDIGISDAVLDRVPVQCFQNEPGLWRLPEADAMSHKYTRGVVSLLSGGTMPGAARLAAGGARGAGAGLVRIAAGSHADLFRLGAPGLVVDDGPLDTLLADKRRKTWICGPGLTPDELSAALPVLLARGVSVLADAGALSAAAGEPERLRGVAVITPHLGEFTGLFGAPGADPLSAARAAAVRIDAVVVLKGASTLIAAPDGRVAINVHATPALGTAGSGDTLSGVIAALCATGMPVWDAACAGVWLHGEAGIRAGAEAGGWPMAEDLDRHLGPARAWATALQEGHDPAKHALE